MTGLVERRALLAYDIADHSKRKRAYKLLLPYRSGGQKSVHECFLNAERCAEIVQLLSDCMVPHKDRLLMAWIPCRRVIAGRVALGKPLPFAPFQSAPDDPRKQSPVMDPGAGDPGWHLYCYDVTESARLSRVHRILKKIGVATQWSVFLAHTNRTQRLQLIDSLLAIMKTEDDLRCYPIAAPEELWQFGKPLAPSVIQAVSAKTKPSQPISNTSFWQRLQNMVQL